MIDADELPTSWVVSRLSDPSVALLNPKKSEVRNIADATEVTFVPMSAVDDNTGSIARPDTRKLAAVRKGYTYFAEGDVLFAKITPCMENGKCAIARGLRNKIGFGSTEFHVVRSAEKSLPEWLHLILRSQQVRHDAENAMRGAAGQQRVPVDFLEQLEIPIPPLAEQRRLVAHIEALTSKLEEARQARQAAIVEAETVFASELSRIFSMELFAHSASASLEDVADIRSGVTLGRKLEGPTISLPYLRVANVQDGHFDLNEIKNVAVLEREREKWLLKSGDLLLTEGGDWDKLGRGSIWREEIPNCIHQNHIFRVRICDTGLIPEFVAALVWSPYGKAYFQSASKQTTNLASINQTQLRAFRICKPPLPEQRRIVARLNALAAKKSELRRLQTETEAELAAFTPALLAKAFRGEL